MCGWRTAVLAVACIGCTPHTVQTDVRARRSASLLAPTTLPTDVPLEKGALGASGGLSYGPVLRPRHLPTHRAHRIQSFAGQGRVGVGLGRVELGLSGRLGRGLKRDSTWADLEGRRDVAVLWTAGFDTRVTFVVAGSFALVGAWGVGVVGAGLDTRKEITRTTTYAESDPQSVTSDSEKVGLVVRPYAQSGLYGVSHLSGPVQLSAGVVAQATPAFDAHDTYAQTCDYDGLLGRKCSGSRGNWPPFEWSPMLTPTLGAQLDLPHGGDLILQTYVHLGPDAGAFPLGATLRFRQTFRLPRRSRPPLP